MDVTGTSRSGPASRSSFSSDSLDSNESDASAQSDSSATTTDKLRDAETDLDRAGGSSQTPSLPVDNQPDDEGLDADAEQGQSILDLSPSAGAQIAGVIGSGTGLFTSAESTARSANASFNADILEQGLGNKSVVTAVVVDNLTGRVFTGTNTRNPVSTPHPVLAERLNDIDPSRMHFSYQGNHAEVHALNEALWTRDALYESQGSSRSVNSADLSSFTMDTAWGKTSNNRGMVAGETAHRCANCTQLTEGVNNLAGDSPAPYDERKATLAGMETAEPPRTAFSNSNRDSAIRGGVTGAGVATGISAINALADGQLTGAEATQVAQDALTGAVTGGAGEVIEDTVARSADRLVGSSLQQVAGTTSRVIGTKLAGAGVAGALVGTGVSAVDQVQAYNRGEVTGAEAIGTVTAEAATGLAAGVSGAAAGALIGSVVPGAGTLVGGAVGFGVGLAAGYGADMALRASGVKDAIASSVTSAIDSGSRTFNKAADTVGGWGRSMSSALGW